MAQLNTHKSSSIVKMLIEGDAGTRKTSALVSLVQAGYKLGIIDFDNLLDPLIKNILKVCPDKIGNVHYKTFRDKLKATSAGPVVDGTPKAFNDAMKMLDYWKDGEEDLGPPSKWGPEWICVIDSLSRLSDQGLNWGEFVTPAGDKSGQKDGRAIVREGQEAVRSFLSLLTSEWFNTNVIVIAHVNYYDRPDGTTKGFPRSPGNKLSPDIPSFFSSILLAEATPAGTYQFRTISTPMIDLKNAADFEMPAVLPWSTGLATFFSKAKGEK